METVSTFAILLQARCRTSKIEPDLRDENAYADNGNQEFSLHSSPETRELWKELSFWICKGNPLGPEGSLRVT